MNYILLQIPPDVTAKSANMLMDQGVLGVMFLAVIAVVVYLFKMFMKQSGNDKQEIKELNERVQAQNKQQQIENRELEKEFREYLKLHLIETHGIINDNTLAFQQFTEMLRLNIEVSKEAQTINKDLIRLISARLGQLEK